MERTATRLQDPKCRQRRRRESESRKKSCQAGFGCPQWVPICHHAPPAALGAWAHRYLLVQYLIIACTRTYTCRCTSYYYVQCTCACTCNHSFQYYVHKGKCGHVNPPAAIIVRTWKRGQIQRRDSLQYAVRNTVGLSETRPFFEYQNEKPNYGCFCLSTGLTRGKQTAGQSRVESRSQILGWRRWYKHTTMGAEHQLPPPFFF